MGAEHTPGPWSVRKVNRYQIDATPRGSEPGYEDFRIANTYASPFSPPRDQAAANARLIAAAPDLLAACVGMLTAWNSPRNLDRVDALCKELDAMEAAVAKARGEGQ